MMGLTRDEAWSVAVTALAVTIIAVAAFSLGKRSVREGRAQTLPALPEPPASVPAPSF
jgi:hypothetical protein